MNRRILVTGGDGFVGQNLQQLVKHDNNDQWFFVDRRDGINLENRQETINYVADMNIDTVIHLAGYVGGIKENTENQYDMLSRNALMALNIVDACLQYSVDTLISVLSTCIYPFNANILRGDAKEEHLRLGFEESNYSYALAKSVLYQQTMNARNHPSGRGRDYKCVVPTNMYGPFNHFGSGAHMINAIMEKLHTAKKLGIKEIELWGNPYTIRQHLYVEDFCTILVALLDKDFDVVNVAPPKSHMSVAKHIEIMSKVIDTEYFARYNGNFNGIASKIVDTQKIETLLPAMQYHSFEEGFRKTYDNYLNLVY